MRIDLLILFIFIYISGYVTNGRYVTYDIDVAKKEYSYSLETPDKTIKQEKRYFKKDITGEENLVVEGSYRYTGNNGKTYVVTYTADKNGYHPKVIFGSDDLPSTSPPPEHPVVPIIPPPPDKGVDPALLCSLIGSGCK